MKYTCILLFLVSQFYWVQANKSRPNILWIFVEDLSPLFGCYDDPVNSGHTETIDTLAAQGVLYKRAYVPAPVCSASRSAMIVGVHQVTTGTEQHRSSRANNGKIVPLEQRIHLPENMKTIPELMREAGYYTFNQGKDDYNFHYDRQKLYTVGTQPSYKVGMNGWQGNGAQDLKNFKVGTWASRPEKSQPWFGQLTLWGGKGDAKYCPKDELLIRDSIKPPAYFPDNTIHRKAWTAHYNHARGNSHNVQQVLDQLKADGELENTVIFYFSDHGNNQSLRHKQFCYEGGLHVPMIVTGNIPQIEPGRVVNQITSTLDISATTLALGGVELPSYLDGQNLFAESYQPMKYIVSARDRCDYTIDKIRSVRTDKFRYIKNYYPNRSLMQPQYRDPRPESKNLRELHKAGQLTEYQAEHWFGARPVEELYDMQADPHQINNLATHKDYQEILVEHRKMLTEWQEKTGDPDATELEDAIQLKSVYELWKNKPVFKNAQTNPEYDIFKN